MIAYRSGGIPELVDDGRTGILTESPDAEALARSIRLLIADPAKMERLSVAGRREWESRFRLETFQQNACDFIENAAGRATTASHSRSPAAAHADDELRDSQETVSR